ncbi:F-box/LRR-repeat protein At2g43260-like [Salvia miltiorrhiza]|uniref:F-box/LRR-repeat protein At2g43260-like n=1 Tax=Salvia miltiorrhiza TaxID=226208 RepID=UPI0025AD7B5D|nr:F-box/LRR-repeat protein At2g43260-like [Salvia miltiorrhiza]
MRNSEKRRVAVQWCKSGTKCLSITSPGDLPEICKQSDLDLPFLDPKVHTYGTSNEGLLLIYDDNHLFLCNPTTKHFRSFPSKYKVHKPDPWIPYIVTAGLGYLSESGDYKIVCVYLCDREDLKMSKVDRFDIQVYSFKSKDWKKIKTPDFCASAWIVYSEPPTCVEGSCYWFACGTKVVSFDFSEEKFSYFSLPSKTDDYSARLIKLDNYYGEDL